MYNIRILKWSNKHPILQHNALNALFGFMFIVQAKFFGFPICRLYISQLKPHCFDRMMHTQAELRVTF